MIFYRKYLVLLFRYSMKSTDYFINYYFSFVKITGIRHIFYTLSYNNTVPIDLIENINRAITSHLESGLESFHLSYAEFLSQVRQEVYNFENPTDADEYNLMMINRSHFDWINCPFSS